MTPSSTDEIAGISAALVAAIAEADAYLKESGIGGQFPGLVRHAGELYALLAEQLVAIEPAVDERTRGMADAIGNNLDRLEAALASPHGLN